VKKEGEEHAGEKIKLKKEEEAFARKKIPIRDGERGKSAKPTRVRRIKESKSRKVTQHPGKRKKKKKKKEFDEKNLPREKHRGGGERYKERRLLPGKKILSLRYLLGTEKTNLRKKDGFPPRNKRKKLCPGSSRRGKSAAARETVSPSGGTHPRDRNQCSLHREKKARPRRHAVSRLEGREPNPSRSKVFYFKTEKKFIRTDSSTLPEKGRVLKKNDTAKKKGISKKGPNLGVLYRIPR